MKHECLFVTVRELDNQIQQAHQQNAMHQQLLQHMIEQQDLEIYDLMLQVRIKIEKKITMTFKRGIFVDSNYYIISKI